MSYREVYEKYYLSIYTVCKFFLKDEKAAEDAVQETFIKLIPKWEGLTDRDNLGAWLRRELSPHAAFFGEAEKKLAKEYAELDAHGELKLSDGGHFAMREGADVTEYERRRRELGMVEVEGIKPRRVGDIGTVKPAVLEALSGFLEFEDEGDNPSA